MANISYIRLLQAVELFSKEHMQVKRFASDFPAQMPNFGTENEKYPILFVSPNDTIFDMNVTTFTIDVYCFDIIQKDRSNINTILSDTNLILSDLHRWLLDGEIYGLDIRDQVTTTPIDNALLDYAAGWRMTATFDVDTYGICEIPFINEPVILMEVNDVVYTTALTCDTLADCDTFTDAIDNLQIQIDNIELIPGPTGPQGVTGSNGINGATGATGASYLEPIFIDSYRGTRLKPIGTTYNGLQVNGTTNTNFGLSVVNTNTGNGAISSIIVSGTNSTGFGMGFQYHSPNYFVPYLRDNTALFSFQDMFIFTSKGKSIDFRTGTNFGDETTKLKINNNGQLSIGVVPTTDNTATDVLLRKSDGSVVISNKSNFIGATGPQGPIGPTGAQGPIGPTGSGNPIVSGYFTPDDNTLTLVDSLGVEVIIQDEINIIEKDLNDILTLIADRKLVRGVTYKINGVDTTLYKIGNNNKGTTIYLLALEDNKLDTFGTGIFYTPKYKDFPIWKSTSSYGVGDGVIWGGCLWTNNNGNVGSAIDDYQLDSTEWELRTFNEDNYNVSWDKIKYDIVNDKITYRNEKNINEVSFNSQELIKIQNVTGDYCPIEAFQWGKDFKYDESKERFEGVGNQKIYNSLNRNINYDGLSQYNIILNNQSFIYDISRLDGKLIMSDIELDNGSYIKNIPFRGDVNFRYITLNNLSYFDDITTEQSCELMKFDLNNSSYIFKLRIINTKLSEYKLDNNSFIENCDMIATTNYNMLYDNNASQFGTNNFLDPDYFYQVNTTIKNTQINVVEKNHDGWFFLGDLPDSNTTDIIGRDSGNRLVDTSLGGYVPYVGATQDLELGEYDIRVGRTLFDMSPTNGSATGALVWNETDGTLDLGLKGGYVTLQIGQEQVVRVVNKTATNITLLQSNYQAVRITGAQGNRLKVDLAQATSDALSTETIGLVTESIVNNQEGFVTTSGLIRDINTTGSLQGETWLDGDILYLSPSVAGRITNVKPVAPNHLIIIGYVVRAHITQGQIFVKVDNGYELDELHNVKISGTPSNNSFLIYNDTSSVWENKTEEFRLRQNVRVISSDFIGTVAAAYTPFTFAGYNGGNTSTTSYLNGTNPGVVRMSSTTTPNSGGVLSSNSLSTGNITPVVGQQMDFVFRTPNTIIGAGSTIRAGYMMAANTVTDATQGFYMEIVDNQLYGKTSATSSRSQTATAYSLTNGGIWFHMRVLYKATSLIEYSLYNMAGTLLWSDTLTTNIPTSLIGCNILAFSSATNTSNTEMVNMDFVSFTLPTSNRGALN